MNCIFSCVFHQEKYVEMFLLFLESVQLYGHIDETHILVYTSTEFMNIIKKSPLCNDNVRFEINDTYHDIPAACKARLDLFQLPLVANYDKILYLDTDILIKRRIQPVFDICVDDILYTLEEGTVDDEYNYWGRPLFDDDYSSAPEDKTAFTSGILLFRNCETMKTLFDAIKYTMIQRPICVFLDQPYVVYTAYKMGCYDNKLLKSFAANHDVNIHNDIVIHHFPGSPGNYMNKIMIMAQFLGNLKSLGDTSA